ncbi:MAG: hypothetical protein RLZZ568_1267 [Cyanobacteriota bacterium]
MIMNRSLLLLLVWMAIAVGLRSWNLAVKPPWTDEFATLVFSLGRSFEAVPGAQWLTVDPLLALLRPLPHADPQGVIDQILARDNHPPLYFVLAHLWYRLFPHDGDYLAVAVGRSLPVLFGVLSVPVGYGCVKWVWGQQQDRLALSVAMAMAVSPYGVFISQEARHYTLAMLWGILSLACCLKGAQYWQRGRPLPAYLSGAWVGVNALGVSTHFLLTLLLVAQGLGLMAWGWDLRRRETGTRCPGVKPFLPVILGTIAVLGVWGGVIYWQGFGNGMTQWIQFDQMSWLSYVLSPPLQLVAAWATMVCLLPVESSQLVIVFVSGVGMLVYFCWLVPVLSQGWARGDATGCALETNLLIKIFACLVGIYLAITYGAGLDITRGARYSFNFWPVVMFLVGIGLAGQTGNAAAMPRILAPQGRRLLHGRGLPAIFLLMGIVSGLTITFNLGYQKYYRPDHFLTLLSQTQGVGLQVIVSPHQSLVQTGEVLGIALEAQRHFPELVPQLRFLLLPASHNRDPVLIEQLQQHLATLSDPFDLWVLNYPPAIALDRCQKDQSPPLTIYGYSYQHFTCASAPVR